MKEDITPEEVEALEEAGYEYPKPDEKANIYNFFKRILISEDTSKTAYLNEDELGMVQLPVRTLKKLALYCNEMGLSGLGSFFRKEANVVTDTSLSREGFLPKLAVTQKRQSFVETKQEKPTKKKWFSKSKSEQNIQRQL